MNGRTFNARSSATVATVVLAILAAVPRAARGAVIPLSQSHLLTANVVAGDTGVADREEGSTIGPVDAEASVSIPVPSNSAVSALDLTFDGRTISGHLDGDAFGNPGPSPITVSAEGSFQHTFTVTEPTPFRLTGEVRIQGRYLGDVGRAELRLTEDGVRIGGNAISAPPVPLGGNATFDNEGTLLPGRTYALTGAMTAGMVVEASSNLTFSNSDVEFTFTTVPEPSAACLLAAVALCLLTRRARQAVIPTA